MSTKLEQLRLSKLNIGDRISNVYNFTITFSTIIIIIIIIIIIMIK